MIIYDFTTETVMRTDSETGEQTTDKRRGALHVWFHDSDPEADPPDQRYDWRAADDQLRFAAGQYPVQVKSVCAYREVAAEFPSRSRRVVRIVAEAALERIQRRGADSLPAVETGTPSGSAGSGNGQS
jgi:hypothetical protein